MARDAVAVIGNLRQALSTAEQGLQDCLGGDGARREVGFYNVAVFGRSVWHISQTLKGVDRQPFEEWSQPWEHEFIADPLLKWFTDLRNQALKEGATRPSKATVKVNYLSTEDLQPFLTNPPPGAEGFFSGDQTGGSGWFIRQPGGPIEKYYVDLPDTVDIEAVFHFRDPPSEHLGRPIDDTSAQNLARLYVQYLRRYVAAAVQEFAPR